MTATVIVMPTRADIIRAYAAENPRLEPAQIAHNLRARIGPVKSPEVVKALSTGDKRRIKSVAP